MIEFKEHLSAYENPHTGNLKVEAINTYSGKLVGTIKKMRGKNQYFCKPADTHLCEEEFRLIADKLASMNAKVNSESRGEL